MKSLTVQQWFKANAIFSTLCAIDLMLFPNLIAQWMHIANSVYLLTLGIGLLGFAAYVYWLSRRPVIDKPTGLQIILADIGWVLGSIVLILFVGFFGTQLYKKIS